MAQAAHAMMYTIQHRPKGVTVVGLQGAPTVYELGELKKTLNEILAKTLKKKKLVVDFSSLVGMDELALGVFVAFSKNYRLGGGELRLSNLNHSIKHLFDYSQLTKVYEIHDTVDKAEKSFIDKR